MNAVDLSGSIKTKYSELGLLSQFIPKAPTTPKRFKDFARFIEHKSLLMRELRANAYLSHLFPNSNYEGHLTEWYGLKFQHRYSRQGDPLTGKNQLTALYPASVVVPAQCYFFSSGQAATHTVMRTLSTHYHLSPKQQSERPYFETLELSHYIDQRKIVGNFFFFDSASQNFNWNNLLRCLGKAVIVFDTTCIDRADSNFAEFSRIARVKKAPAILIRSHLKLDSYGVEYGLLGSAVILNPGEFPELRMAGVKVHPLKTIQGAVKSVGGVLGHFPTIDSIYPFLTSDLVTNSNSLRLARIRQNALRLHRYLTQKGISSELRPHNYFLEVRRTGIGPIKTSIATNKWRIVTGFPIYFSDSFGFDFSAVTTYRDYHLESETEVIRLSPPDLLSTEFENGLGIYERLVEFFLR